MTEAGDTMQSINQMELKFLSVPENEGFARVAVSAFAVQFNPTLDVLADIKTAVSEAVTNAVVHAYPSQIGRILMKLRILEGDVLEITVKDWGCGIPDVAQAMEPLYTTGGEERSGMGFSIMACFTDKLQVRSAPGKGTKVVMRKKIAQRTVG